MGLRLSAAVLLLLLAGAASAQTTGEGSVTFGAGGYSNGSSSGPVVQFGGGGEAVVNHRVGFGADLMLTAGGGDAWYETSLKTEYRFTTEVPQRATPFLSGGYTRLGALTERGGYDGVNFGGGVSYAFGREALRIEARDVLFDLRSRATQYLTVRVSLTFRLTP